jgi:hypothetical protein
MKVEDRIKKMTSTRRNLLWNDICRLKGHPPYNKPNNIFYGDAYFSRSLESKYQMSGEELNQAFSLLRLELDVGPEDTGRTAHFKEVLPTVETNAVDPTKLHVVKDSNWGKANEPRKRVRPKQVGKWGTNTPKRYEASYRIDPDGDLMVKRAGRYIHQPCPHAGMANCGDSCPHFREPVFREAQVHIPICMGTVLICHVKNFDDERNGNTE